MGRPPGPGQSVWNRISERMSDEELGPGAKMQSSKNAGAGLRVASFRNVVGGPWTLDVALVATKPGSTEENRGSMKNKVFEAVARDADGLPLVDVSFNRIMGEDLWPSEGGQNGARCVRWE